VLASQGFRYIDLVFLFVCYKKLSGSLFVCYEKLGGEDRLEDVGIALKLKLKRAECEGGDSIRLCDICSSPKSGAVCFHT